MSGPRQPPRVIEYVFDKPRRVIVTFFEQPASFKAEWAISVIVGNGPAKPFGVLCIPQRPNYQLARRIALGCIEESKK